MLHYRTFRNQRKSDLKNQHAIIHGIVLIFVLLAGWASFASHIYSIPSIPNLYSLHSWLGVLTISMFLSQVSEIFIYIINIEYLYKFVHALFLKIELHYV